MKIFSHQLNRQVGDEMRTYRSLIFKLLAYAWAAPNTVLGILLGLVILGLGGKMRVVSGVTEFHGGKAGRFLASRPHPFCFGAMTLGHVILGTCHRELAALRAHEHVHVRQYERWGMFFLPAYALSSLWEVSHGRRGYRNNFFERQAYAAEDKHNSQLTSSIKQDA